MKQYLWILLFLVVACTKKEAPVPAPAATWQHAVSLLEAKDWTVGTKPEERSGPGCVAATRGTESGKVCFQNCDGKSADEIMQATGPAYGYQVGEKDKCGTYASFEGSAEFRDIVAGPDYSAEATQKKIDALAPAK